ncbi:FadR/GntR family transcriptional regulator [Salinicoccus albus]|uniref:FadR/GntR family transcriptional regulator n=1 Tax=Salinicoccus albus TaxID=418756 RepID=UPI000364C123|nr:FCD domain-containing protein [Salinicoccus albus]
MMDPINSHERKSLKQTVIQEIKDYITDNQLAFGDKLPTERRFTEIFGVSRSVVREALSYLENTGVIYIRQGQGAFLKRSNMENLLENFFFLWQINGGEQEEILSLRLIFEASAIDEIIRNDDTAEMEALHRKAGEDKASVTADTFRAADRQFHEQLLNATDNHLFTQMTGVITNYFFQIARDIDLTEKEAALMMAEHESITAALIERDSDKAKALLADHIYNVRRK